MIFDIFLVIIGLIVLVVLWFILKNFVKLIINSILGLIILVLVNFLHLFPLIGYPNIQITWISVIVCAIAGIPGAIILILLHFLGLA